VLGTRPEEGETDVDRGVWLTITYDRPLDPRTVGRESVTLSSGPLVPFLEVRFDPVTRTLRARPFGGRPLEPSVRYTLEVSGVRDLDGALAKVRAFGFRTGETFSAPPGEGLTTWASVAPIFTTHCVDACHDGGARSAGLDLRTLASTRETTVGVPADQTGGTGAVGRLGLGGMARIEGADPARSYLLYKMLADPHVWGEPMPPGGPLARSDVALVADWILGGAR